MTKWRDLSYTEQDRYWYLEEELDPDEDIEIYSAYVEEDTDET